jgi:hypothetical protein
MELLPKTVTVDAASMSNQELALTLRLAAVQEDATTLIVPLLSMAPEPKATLLLPVKTPSVSDSA